jgi:signal transduction histidine kinase
LNEVSGFFQPLAEQKSITLQSFIPCGLPDACADTQRVRHILNNLLSNAIKYTQPGGAVALRALGEAGWITIEVQDTGIGLSDEDTRHLFVDKFYRSRRTEVQSEKGSGLGLLLVKGIVEAQGGRVWFESPKAGGTIFRFTLPTAHLAEAYKAPRQGETS